MKQKSIYFIILSAMLACCTQDETADNIHSTEESLHVSSAILEGGSHTEMNEPATRLTNRDVPIVITQGSLGIFRSLSPGYTGSQDNKKYIYDAAGWQPGKPGDAIFLNVSPAYVCAYYPYNSTYSNKEAIPLTSGEYTDSNTHDPNDLCYKANLQKSASDRNVTFNMEHAMAMLEFKLSKENGYIGDCRISSVTLQNPNLITSSTINISDGSYTTLTKGGVTYSIGKDTEGILIESKTFTTSALLVPFHPAAPGLSVSFTVNNAPMEIKIPIEKLTNVVAGRRYTVNVTLQNNQMQVTGVDMMPWIDHIVGGDGNIYQPQI